MKDAMILPGLVAAVLVGGFASSATAGDLASVKDAIVTIRWKASDSGKPVSWVPGVTLPEAAASTLVPLGGAIAIPAHNPNGEPQAVVLDNKSAAGGSNVALLADQLRWQTTRTRRATGFVVGDYVVGVLPKSAHKERDLVVIDAAGEKHEPEVVAWDDSTGLTLLHVEGMKVAGLVLADAAVTWGENVRLAHEWRAGNPALVRGIVSTTPTFNGELRAVSFDIDTLTPLNATGAPILNADCEVAAVIKSPRSETGESGPGIAMTLDKVRQLLAFVRGGNTGTLPRAMIGAALHASDAGVTVGKVVYGSPAAKSGLEAGDVVKSVNGELVDRPEDVVALIDTFLPGDTVALEIVKHEGDAAVNEIRVGDAADILEQPAETPNQAITTLEGPVILRSFQPAEAPAAEQPSDWQKRRDEQLRQATESALRRVRVTAIPPDVNQRLEDLRKEIAEMKSMLESVRDMID